MQCLADSCVFRLVEGGKVAMYLVVHVDNIFAVGKKGRCDQFDKDLRRLVPVKSLGELKWYSGCYYERDREAGRLTISHRRTRKNWERSMAWNGATVFRFLQLRGFGILMLTSRMFCFLFES